VTARAAALLLLGGVAVAGQTPAARPAPGEPAPAFEAPATTGGTLTLASFKGKQTVVLAFFPKAFTPG
jgi:peroxiredoxin Q/BCP